MRACPRLAFALAHGSLDQLLVVDMVVGATIGFSVDGVSGRLGVVLVAVSGGCG